MAWNVGGSIRVAGVADAAAIAAVHVEAWRETYVGIVPVQVLAGLSVDRRTQIWRRILTNPTAFSSSAVFVAEREEKVVGFGCCGMQRASTRFSALWAWSGPDERNGWRVAAPAAAGGEPVGPSRERERSPIL